MNHAAARTELEAQPRRQAAAFFSNMEGRFSGLARGLDGIPSSTEGIAANRKRLEAMLKKSEAAITAHREQIKANQHLEKHVGDDWRFLIFNAYHHGHLLARRLGGVQNGLITGLHDNSPDAISEARNHAEHGRRTCAAFRKLFTNRPAVGRVDLRGLVEDVARSFSQSHFDSANITISGPRKVVVSGDPDLLYLATYNLFRNAVNASEESRIGIHIANHRGRATVTIRDSGRGLTDYHKHIFSDDLEQLRQEVLDYLREDRVPKAGVGILSTRHILESMGGKAEIAATGPAGTTLKITLPTAQRTERL